MGATAVAMGASAAMSMWQQAQQEQQQARQMLAKQQDTYKQLNKQRDLNYQNNSNNYQRIQQNRLKNDLAIEDNKLQAESDFAAVFASSGISGNTIDELHNKLKDSVAKAHLESASKAKSESLRGALALKRFSKKATNITENTEMFDEDLAASNIFLAGMSSAVGTAANRVDKWYPKVTGGK